MSLTFQNADSIKQALLEELQNILSSDTATRTSAEGRMKQLEFTEGYGVYLAEIIMNQSFELCLRQLACIMLTRYVENRWGQTEDAQNVTATDQAKKTIRNILPNGLYDPNSKIRSSVAYTISTIASWDWPDVWTELFDVIIKCLGGNEDSIHGAMQVLAEFTYEGKQMKVIRPIILSEVYRIFEAEQTYSVKTRTCAIKILKPLFSSIIYSISNKEEQTAIIDSVLPKFMEKLIYNLSVSRDTVLKTEIVKVLTFLVTEMRKYIQPYMNQILTPIWQLLTQTADIYVKEIVNNVEPFSSHDSHPGDEDADDELSNFTTMIIQVFEFIQCIIVSGKFRSIIKNVLTDLIYIIIVYIQVTEEQTEMWNSDPEKFVEDEDDAGVDLTVRLSGQDVLTSINEEFGTKSFASLSEALTRHVNVAEAEKTAGNPNWWKIHEAAMVAVHTFKDLILESENFDLLNYLTLVRNLMNFQTSPYLLGRCLWTLSAYSKSKLYNPQMLEEILDVTLSSLSQDKPMVLKICAVRAIYGFVTNIHKSEDDRGLIILSKLNGFVDGIMAMIGTSQSTVLSLLLEALTIIISFDDNFAASVQSKVIPLTIAIFLKYPEDPFILELVQDMLKALSQNPLCLQPLQEKIIPTLVSIFNLQNDQARTANQEIALDVLATLVKYSQPPLSDNLIENAFPAAVHCILRSDDHSVMVSGGECLRAFVYTSPEQICAYKNGEGLKYIMQVTEMLLNPRNSELTAGHIGRLVITIIIKMGNMLGENVDLLLKAVISKMQLVECLKVIMSLVVIFAHLFLTQMDAVLNFLSTVPGPTGEPAMHFLFSNWLTRQHLFFGAYERKVTTMALCKLFEYGVTTQDSRLTSITIKDLVINNTSEGRTTRSKASTSQTWVSIPALVKIFKLLINELGSLRDAKQSDDESETQSDDEQDTSEKSPNKIRTVSDLYFNDEDDENADDDQLMQELLKDPIFQTNMEDNLTKFLQNFSTSEHFPMFVEQLNDSEKATLRSIQVENA
ncbi:unnamed protein product [Hermetia illucens]|uniref:Importin N-terminal domain-containing protein n=1 Tax=Hermetia illucens TaxID=343691 RepID=A0A7R8V5J7_HERIL|nr:importin-9 isoform X2 [Hermetia illucens]CAD7093271.1 unnamed protein product [Hermetia illucens]